MRLRGRWLVPFVACVACIACAPYRPPFTQASTATAQATPHRATLVFLWPVTSCDPAGYFTLVSADGRFIGTIAPGTQLRTDVAAGDTTVIGWNEIREEAGGAGNRSNVPVLRAHLAEGRTYYVRMLFGEWDETGPGRQRWAWGRARIPTPLCAGVRGGGGATSAMVTLTPVSDSWKELPGWTARLEAIAPDRAAGQAWLNERGEALWAHIAAGEERYEGLRPEAKRLATVETEDGVSTER